ncbi:MAG: acyloxyacyl hydrolase [Candidatus Omnitrophica bacterium]|nr:acyloxyacyl hydrolase [Candidatus Omnitrophota bacterium]MBL7210418.1 acyloxyacyl hydrolase [Candidatus Omnitrophota bacterium]
MKKALLFLTVIFAATLVLGTALAEEPAASEVTPAAQPYQLESGKNPEATLPSGQKTKYFEGIEFLTGFEWGKIHDTTRNYNVVPFLVAFDFTLKPLLQKININPSPLVQFQIEPFLSFITSPHSNVELGTSFLFKVGLLPQGSKLQPYVKAGVGMIYLTQHFGEQGTQFNFIESGGVGVHYLLRKNIFLTVEGRMRHLSNAGIAEPNHGVNTYFALAGLSYEF